ncbi:protein mono-ADP-ribosyltransferase PARP12-like [Cloeon dipterum]|uniref:protein mono-ADP-ribosyltransferase PARP12-like n=1 Tax=Cloeon dipterum TaxID=197152 RepID=UPI0032208E5F
MQQRQGQSGGQLPQPLHPKNPFGPSPPKTASYSAHKPLLSSAARPPPLLSLLGSHPSSSPNQYFFNHPSLLLLPSYPLFQNGPLLSWVEIRIPLKPSPPQNTLRPAPSISLQLGKALDLPLPSPPSCRHPDCIANWRGKINGRAVVKSPTKTFLQAYPTGRLCDEELQSLLPLDWSPTCVHDFRRFGLVRVPLPPGYECVVHSLNMQLGGERVRAVEKVENPYQFLLYQLKMMEGDGGLERVLFHGTSYANILSITRDNLNWRLAGSRVGHRHGLGVYFSTSASFCLRFGRQSRCFLVARVPVGAISRGSSTTRLPGPSADATGDGRHTVVKYHDHEFYPQYVVHF